MKCALCEKPISKADQASRAYVNHRTVRSGSVVKVKSHRGCYSDALKRGSKVTVR